MPAGIGRWNRSQIYIVRPRRWTEENTNGDLEKIMNEQHDQPPQITVPQTPDPSPTTTLADSPQKRPLKPSKTVLAAVMEFVRGSGLCLPFFAG